MSTQPPSRTRFYRDKRNGKVMGVCAGIADYTGLDVTLVRIMLVAAILLGSGVARSRSISSPAGSPEDSRASSISDDEDKRNSGRACAPSPTRTARDIR